MPRIACLHLPLFPLAARLRSEPELAREALAVVEGNGNAARVVAATRLARAAGLRPGLTLPQARALCPKLVARPRDAGCERAAQEALLEVAEAFSPRVEDAGEGIAYLDVDGIDRHYPGTGPGSSPELAMGRALMNAADAAGLPARVGIASSKLAARVASGLASPPAIVPAGEEAAFLAPLPLQRLAPEVDVAETLERWGVRSVGDFARLPPSRIASPARRWPAPPSSPIPTGRARRSSRSTARPPCRPTGWPPPWRASSPCSAPTGWARRGRWTATAPSASPSSTSPRPRRPRSTASRAPAAASSPCGCCGRRSRSRC